MRECPKCGYVDPPYWRNRLFDYEVDICMLDDLQTIDPDLWLELSLNPPRTTITHSPFVYKLTSTGWVYRIWESLFKVRGWQQHYDGSGSRASALRKTNLRAYSTRQAYMNDLREAPEHDKLIEMKKELEEIKKLVKNDDIKT